MADELLDEKTITLRRPVEANGQSYSELNLREPTADELLQINKFSGTEADIFAVSLISGVPKAAIGKIGARDLIAAAGFIGNFLSASPQTGEKS